MENPHPEKSTTSLFGYVSLSFLTGLLGSGFVMDSQAVRKFV